MSLWRAVHPALRVGAVMVVFALTLLAVNGAPPFLSAQARTGSRSGAPPASGCANCPTLPAPFRMLPSDLGGGGASKHAPAKGPFLGTRRGAHS